MLYICPVVDYKDQELVRIKNGMRERLAELNQDQVSIEAVLGIIETAR
jgi:hypothetical protein